MVAALSSQVKGRPCTRSCRIGKSRRTSSGSSGRLAISISGTTSGAKSETGGFDCKKFRSPSGLRESGVPGTGPRTAVPRVSFCSGNLVGGAAAEIGKAGGDSVPGPPGRENNSGVDGKITSGALKGCCCGELVGEVNASGDLGTDAPAEFKPALWLTWAGVEANATGKREHLSGRRKRGPGCPRSSAFGLKIWIAMRRDDCPQSDLQFRQWDTLLRFPLR